MKKFYFFSLRNLQFREVKNFRFKIVLVGLGILIFSGLLTATGFYLYDRFLNAEFDFKALQAENKELRKQVLMLSSEYKALGNELDSLINNNNELRLAVNLPPLTPEERKVGIGGAVFEEFFGVFKAGKDRDLNKAFNYIGEVKRKFEFERNNYNDISSKLISNQKLFEALPAIIPSSGTIARNGFGMRLHPILRVVKMHEGIDIITDVGTPVYATGAGTVTFVGTRGGLGRIVEIDHSFGYRTIYAHLKSQSVREGQQVKRGDKIALSGNSGLSSGPHLHYEVIHNGEHKDPELFFFDNLGIFAYKNLMEKQ